MLDAAWQWVKRHPQFAANIMIIVAVATVVVVLWLREPPGCGCELKGG